MLIWIVTTGEPIPEIDGKSIRPWRSTLLAYMLISRGHKVIRWSSTFDHSSKINRFNTNRLISVNSQYDINLFYSRGYSSNVSIKRLLDHKESARNYKKLIDDAEKPDIILCSLPTLELCHVSVHFANRNNIPIVLDIRDLWPDIFLEIFPNKLNIILKLFLRNFYNSLTFSCTNATAISGISSEYISWGLSYALRDKSDFDRFFPHGYMKNNLKNEQRDISALFWHSFNFIEEDDFIVCLFSSLGNVIDIYPIIEAANRFEIEGIPIKFVLCGDGVRFNEFKTVTQRCKNILLPGWVDKNQITYLMNISRLGILPYKNLQNYQLNIPNKPIEYLSAGLPVVTSVSGLLKNTIEEYKCGKYYSSKIKFDLYNTISYFFYNPDELIMYSKNASTLYESHFNSNIVYKEMAAYLEQLNNEYHEKI